MRRIFELGNAGAARVASGNTRSPERPLLGAKEGSATWPDVSNMLR